MTPKKAKIIIVLISVICIILIAISLFLLLLINEPTPETEDMATCCQACLTAASLSPAGYDITQAKCINFPTSESLQDNCKDFFNTNPTTVTECGNLETELLCSENWQCSGWNKCIESIQTRTCFDLNKCGTLLDRPDIKQGCVMPEPEIIEDEFIDINLGDEFQMKIGQTAEINSENIKIKFLSVMEDSRCPADVQCFWRGVATIQLNLIKNDQNLGVYIISDYNFNNWKNELEVDNYKITLVDINPTPTADQKPEEIDYIATLTISMVESADIEETTDKFEDIVPS